MYFYDINNYNRNVPALRYILYTTVLLHSCQIIFLKFKQKTVTLKRRLFRPRWFDIKTDTPLSNRQSRSRDLMRNTLYKLHGLFLFFTYEFICLPMASHSGVKARR